MTKEDHNLFELLKTCNKEFYWGVSSSAAQTEGSYLEDGRKHSIWDVFAEKKKRIYKNHKPHVSTDFYTNYQTDIDCLSNLSIPNLRTSISWSRIIPNGNGKINQKGIDFYNRLIDYCLAKQVNPWFTLYHWDLPYELELKGGWTNRDIINYFLDYTAVCADNFGDRIKNWMVLNEPMVFTGAGYFLGIHAPGKKGLKNFLPAVHHATICQAQGIKVLKRLISNSNIGTTFSYSHIEPFSQSKKDIEAARKADSLLNKLFLHPLLGMGYPISDVPFLRGMEKYIIVDDEKLMMQIPDFVGLQNYTREIVKHSYFSPYLNSKIIPAEKRNVPITTMQWEIYPKGIYESIKELSNYKMIKSIIITENGASFNDEIKMGKIEDIHRIKFLTDYLTMVLKAKNEGAPVDGYFVWSATDNFEWAEGYYPKFGLIHIDFETQKRTIKDSGYWYSKIINEMINKNE